jgi:dephospho-CoA kinase
MIRIGIIGDIGAGKTYVAKLFRHPIFNADQEVSNLYKKSRKCYGKLKKALPKYINSFPINKKLLTKAILNSNSNLKKIIKIVHPEVRMKMNSFIKKNRNKKIIILDIPLLIENKLNKKDDILIFVEGKKKEILKRLKKRPNFNEKIINRLKTFQLPLEVKKKKSNFVIKNNFNDNIVKKNVKKIKKIILLNA